MEEEKKEETKEETKEEPKVEPETKEEKTETAPSTEKTTEEKEVERTPVEEAVAEKVNSGDAKEMAKINEKLDIIMNLLADKHPTFDADDSAEHEEEHDKTSEAELEAIENILD